MKKFAFLLLLPFALTLAGCAAQIGVNQYDSSAVGSVNRARMGTIVSVRQITVADSNGSLGTTIGGIAGGVAGSQIGSGSTAAVLGAVGGALVGGAAGNMAQRGLSSQSGYEYVVQLDGGGLITVTQGSDVLMTTGQRCMVLYGSGSERARIIPYNGYGI